MSLQEYRKGSVFRGRVGMVVCQFEIQGSQVPVTRFGKYGITSMQADLIVTYQMSLSSLAIHHTIENP